MKRANPPPHEPGQHLTPSLSPSEGERVPEGRVRGRFRCPGHEFLRGILFLTLAVATQIPVWAATQETVEATNRTDTATRRGRFGGPEPGVYKARITPHWFHDNTRFWYRNDLQNGTTEFIVVDAQAGTRQPAFDHQRLAAALSKATGQSFSENKLPFSTIEFVQDDKVIQFDAADKSWQCNLETYECSPTNKGADARGSGAPLAGREPSEAPTAAPLDIRVPTPAPSGTARLSQRAADDSTRASSAPLISTGLQPDVAEDRTPEAASAASPETEIASDPSPSFEGAASPAEAEAATEQRTRRQNGRTGEAGAAEPRRSDEPERERRSPDHKWNAFVKDHNVWVHSEDEGKDYQLTQDGEEGNAYGRLDWAPDSEALAAWRIEPGDHKEVYFIQSSPPGGGRAKFRARPYDLPGDKLALYELSVFDMATRKQTKPDVDRYEHGWEPPVLHWTRDQRHFCYVKVDRGHQRYRVIEVDSRTGALRNLIDEKTETFIWTAHTENLNLNYVNWLEKSEEIIYVSERDGWRHLYLVDTKAGKLKNQITRGEYVVRGIDRIDEENRQVWFHACGKNPGQDPYFMQYYRVNFDGTGLAALTEGDGNHSVQYSPDRQFLIDTWSRVDQPPVHELRRVGDCSLVTRFEEADISELKKTGWQPPEVFVAKGRDGTTDIWGIICRPKDFNPAKSYPVLEQIYAGPQGSYVPKSFGGVRRFASLTDLGFVVVQMDGMGTANRSKAFHDVCWKNLKDAGFPDRILWHKAVAAKYSWYDITRVGIYGTSAGGQNAAGAVLFHPEFYKAAVANSGCHDNRMDKASWNEQWMGYPVGPQYAESSNIEHASLLQGHLMLVVGEMDDNVPPESTFRFVDALIRANKDFELLVVPNGGHGAGGSYGQRRLQDFFVRYLQGTEPPNRNMSAK